MSKPRVPGLLRGFITIVSDDDDHLKDFIDYMPPELIPDDWRGATMTWHSFKEDQWYPVFEILYSCNLRLRAGEVLDEAGKADGLKLFEALPAGDHLQWRPFSTGWGASPFNGRCWRDRTGHSIVADVSSR